MKFKSKLNWCNKPLKEYRENVTMYDNIAESIVASIVKSHLLDFNNVFDVQNNYYIATNDLMYRHLKVIGTQLTDLQKTTFVNVKGAKGKHGHVYVACPLLGQNKVGKSKDGQ